MSRIELGEGFFYPDENKYHKEIEEKYSITKLNSTLKDICSKTQPDNMVSNLKNMFDST